MGGHSPRFGRAIALWAGLALALQTGCSERELPMGMELEQPAFTQVASAPVVNSLSDTPTTPGCDDAECTLREAIDFSTAGATITFSSTLPAGTITLTDNLTPLYWNLTIVGPGADKLTVNANGSSDQPRRGLVVYATVSVSGLTITGGYSGGGAGIQNEGTLTLSNVVVTGNTSVSEAGGIYNSGTLTVSHSTISNNTGNPGGGIRNEGILVVDHSTVSGNTASSYGWGTGGGISAGPYWQDEAASVTTTIRNSTISGNVAYCRGGGIDNARQIRIEHTTITGNSVIDGDAGNGCSGGGLQSYLGEGQSAEIVGSIIWGNQAAGAANDVVDVFELGTFTSLGHNLIGAAGFGVDFSVDFAATGDQTGVSNAGLGALMVNEPGTTATHALLEGSPALDTGTCTGLGGSTVEDDQRGVTRPRGSTCDIGAYEGGAAVQPSFTSACTYKLNAKNGSYATTVSWSNADPGVTRIVVTDGRTITKQMAPTASGSWTTTVKSAPPRYEIWGGATRKDASTELKASTACTAAGG